MTKKLPNPFEYRDHLKELEKIKQKEDELRKRIQAVLDGEKPKDVMSWEYYIWESHRDPLTAMTKRKGR
jgi:hypothetical protein